MFLELLTLKEFFGGNLTLFRLGGGGGLLMPAPNLISSQFQTI